MKITKTVTEYTQEIQQEVDRRYESAGHKPNGFGDSMYAYKLAILSDLFEKDEELGMPRAKNTAYGKVADIYEACGSWN
jgi:hypothetical protein